MNQLVGGSYRGMSEQEQVPVIYENMETFSELPLQ